jgi:hypothetical protein
MTSQSWLNLLRGADVPRVKEHCSVWNRQQVDLLALNADNDATCCTSGRSQAWCEAIMTSSKERAAEFRRQASACFAEAERMSLKEDRARMIGIAEHLVELAKRAEAETE